MGQQLDFWKQCHNTPLVFPNRNSNPNTDCNAANDHHAATSPRVSAAPYYSQIEPIRAHESIPSFQRRESQLEPTQSQCSCPRFRLDVTNLNQWNKLRTYFQFSRQESSIFKIFQRAVQCQEHFMGRKSCQSQSNTNKTLTAYTWDKNIPLSNPTCECWSPPCRPANNWNRRFATPKGQTPHSAVLNNCNRLPPHKHSH